MNKLVVYYDYSQLPSHIITQVLSNLKWSELKNATYTCRSFYYASYHPIIINRICLAINPDLQNIHCINRGFSHLKLTNVNFTKFDYIDFLSKFGSQICELTLTHCNISLTQLLEIFIFLINLSELKIYPKNETFDLKKCSFDSNHLMASSVEQISKNLSNIQKLEVQSHSCNFAGIEILLAHIKNLKHFIFYCDWNSNFEINKLFPIIQQWNFYNLKHLEINCMNNTTEQCHEFFKQFSKFKQNNLKYLKLSDLSNLYYGIYFKEFCASFSKLEILKLYQCNERQLVDICHFMPSLVVLVLSGLVTSSMKAIGNLTEIKTLNLYKENIFLSGFRCVQELFDIQFNNLSFLDLSYPVTRDNLNSLCKNFRQLCQLKLRYLQTTYCYPILKNLTNLKVLLIYFKEVNEPEILPPEHINISNLNFLEKLEINSYTRGISPEDILQLPILTKFILTNI